MEALRFRVQNFRNIDDSGWIPLNRVTAFVGRNESGKTSLLKALHKFNPATEEPYDVQREFPRDRYTSDNPESSAGDWPVCTVEFSVPKELQSRLSEILEGQPPPETVTFTCHYDGTLITSPSPTICDPFVAPEPVMDALDDLASCARRLRATDHLDEGAAAEVRKNLVTWATKGQEELRETENLWNVDGQGQRLLESLLSEVENHSRPETADMIEAFRKAVDPILDQTRRAPIIESVDELLEEQLPVFIYFENYGMLNSAIWLPQFLRDLGHNPRQPSVRTINAMFKHVGLDAEDIHHLGQEQPRNTNEQIAKAHRIRDKRAIKLNAASNDITNRFSDWWSQRRHRIRYDADGDYFRIWVADDRRPDVDIELEARSKGFQWFFSFYLVFLVESEDFHKKAILLLDEPGLHLHATAQQELISFFENLSENNQLLYTTHSPFLVDGNHLHRVRAVMEDENGRSQIAADTWPMDRETIFPLQAAAGYAMIRGLFRYQKNVLVEGMTDFYYLHALSHQCADSGRKRVAGRHLHHAVRWD